MHNPDDVDSRVKYAQYIAQAGDLANAQTVLQSVIARHPDRQDAVDLAVKLFRESKDANAQKAADQLLEAVAAERQRLASQSPKGSEAPAKSSSE